MNSAHIKASFYECMPLFIALGDEIRLTIVEILAASAMAESDGNFTLESLQKSGLSVREITEHTSLSRPAISHHLKILKDSGIISMHQKGTCNYYYLTIADSTHKLISLGYQLKELYTS